MPGAVDDDQFRPPQAGHDLGCHRGVGPRVRRPGHDERGDVERGEQRPVIGPAAAAAQCRRGARRRGGGHHGIDAGADGGRASRAVQARVHVVHQDAHPVALGRVGSLVPDPEVLRRGRLRRRGDQPERPVAPGRGRRQFHGHQPAHAQAHHRRPGDPERGEQFLDVGGVLPHQHAARRDRAAAEAPQVGRDHPEGSAQRGQLRFPQRPVERMAVDQDHALAAARIVIRKLHRESVEHGWRRPPDTPPPPRAAAAVSGRRRERAPRAGLPPCPRSGFGCPRPCYAERRSVY